MSSNLNGLREEIDDSIKDNDFEEACKAAILLGDALVKQGKAGDALKVFEEAKEYSKNLVVRRDLEFKADRGYLDAICHHTGNQSTIRYALNEFSTIYDTEITDIKTRQDTLFFIADIYVHHLTKIPKHLEMAHKYALRSSEWLEKFEVKNADYNLCKASLSHIFALIHLEQDELDEAAKRCDEGLSCDSINNDPILHLVLWDTKRKCTLSRIERLEFSLKMLEVYQCGLKSNKKEKFDVHVCLGEDYLAQKDLENAEKCYGEIYFDNDCRNFDDNRIAELGLINLYKINQRIERVREIETDPSTDSVTLAKMYEKIADVATEKLWAHEFAIEYYTKMLRIAQDLDNTVQPLKFELIDDSFSSLAETSIEMKDYQKAVNYYAELYDTAKSLNVSHEVLIEIALNKAIQMINCDSYSFDKKESELLNLLPLITKNIHFEHFYANYILLLTKYKKRKTRAKESIAVLRKKLKEYGKSVIKSDCMEETAPCDIIDEYDEMSDEDILKRVGEKWKLQKEIETLKKQKFHRNFAGETKLHCAVKRVLDSFEFANLLIEKCGYEEIIDEQDYLGMTPLFYAMIYEKWDIAKLYIENGANANISTTKKFTTVSDREIPSGQTPLMIAAAHGNVEMLQLLVENGADPLMKDENGKSAADYMAEYKQLHHDDTVIESNGNIILEVMGNIYVHSQNENVQIPSTSNTQDSIPQKDTVNISDEGFEDQSGITLNGSIAHKNISDDTVSVDIFDNESSSDDENQNVAMKRTHSNTSLNEDEISSKRLKSDEHANYSSADVNENVATD